MSSPDGGSAWLRSPWTMRFLLATFLLFQIGFGLVGPFTGQLTDVEHYRRAGARLLATGSPYGDMQRAFLYPPALAAIFTVAVPFRPRAVAAVWAVVSALVLVIAVAYIAKGRAEIVLLALVFAPFASTQLDGQANALILLAIAAGRSLLPARESAGGLAIGLSLAVKPLALPAAAALAARGRVRAAGIAIGVAVASLLIVLPFGGSPVRAARRMLGILTAVRAETDPADISLARTLDLLLGPEGAALRRLALRCIPLVVVLAAVLRKVSPVATFDAVLAGTLLGARFSWLHHATVLFPAVVSLGPRAASAIAVLFVLAAARGFLGIGSAICGVVALGTIAVASLGRDPPTKGG